VQFPEIPRDTPAVATARGGGILHFVFTPRRCWVADVFGGHAGAGGQGEGTVFGGHAGAGGQGEGTGKRAGDCSKPGSLLHPPVC
jgi:hypothetical protein